MTVQVSYGAGSPVGEPGIERALADIAAGRPVVVVDDEDRENQGDLVFAAQKATPELMAFVVRHTSGFVCVALPGADCDRLSLSAMYRTDHDPDGTAYMVTVDAADGISTGISAADRARTVRVLADPGAGPADLRRPGHVVPLRAKEDGVLRRRGHTEAAVDLARLAGLRPAGVLAEIVSRDAGAGMACHDELETFAADHGLQVVTIADLVAHRRRTETQVRRVAEARMPLAAGMFRAVGYASVPDGSGHVAFVCGDIDDGSDVLVRVHSECLTGDVFGSLRCDCGAALQTALERVAQEGRGVVLYIRGREGRGGGLLRELRAYQVQDRAAGVTGAGIAAPFPADDHDHDDGIGEQILHDLGVRSVRLPAGEPPASSPANLAYLPTGRDRTGDRLPDLAAATGT